MGVDTVKIFLTAVRHGETDANAKGILQGHYDVPLNEVGEKQAKLCGNRLKDVPFALVMSSDLRRAFRTASTIVETNNHFKDVDKIEKDVILRERNFGPKFENRPVSEFKKAASLAGCKTTYEYAPEGVDCESEDGVRARAETFAEAFLRRIANLKDGSHVLVVSHGGWLRHFVGFFRANGKMGSIPKVAHRPCSPNTGVTQFSLCLDKNTGNLQTGECLNFYDDQHLRDNGFQSKHSNFAC